MPIVAYALAAAGIVVSGKVVYWWYKGWKGGTGAQQ